MIRYPMPVNGTYYVVEAVPETRFKKFWVVSAYMDADGGTQAPDAVRPGNTPNASLASSPSANSTVSQPQNHVNRKVSPNNSTGAVPYGFDPLSNAANQYGAIPPGTNAARVVDIPRQMDADTKVSYTSRSAAEAQATPDSFVPIIENETVKGLFSYVPVTNDATTAKAVQNIETNGYQDSLRDWTAKARAGIANEDTVATGAPHFACTRRNTAA